MASVLNSSPRPVPVIVTDSPFSQRKRTPFRASRPPKAPAKSCPPVSRVFLTPTDNGGPKLVSFKSERKAGEKMSQGQYNLLNYALMDKL